MVDNLGPMAWLLLPENEQVQYLQKIALRAENPSSLLYFDKLVFSAKQFFAAIGAAHFPAAGTAIDASAAAIFTNINNKEATIKHRKILLFLYIHNYSLNPMRYFGNLFWGALLLMLGIIALLWATDVIENIAFLKVWWPMFIIIPCAIRLMFAPDKIMSLLGLGIGVVLQLYRCGLIEDFMTTAAITGAVALIMIALQVLTRGGRMPRGGHR